MAIIGSYRQLVTIEQATPQVGALGGVTYAWESRTRAWARLVERRSTERESAGEITAPARATWEVRTPVTVADTDRVNDGRNAWAVREVVPAPQGAPLVTLITELLSEIPTIIDHAFGSGFGEAFE